MVKGKAVPLQT